MKYIPMRKRALCFFAAALLLSVILSLSLPGCTSEPEPAEPKAFVPREYYNALLEPKDTVFSGAGQDRTGFDGYVGAVGKPKTPVIYMFYTGIRENLAADFQRLASELKRQEEKTGAYLIAQVGLSMTMDGYPDRHYEQDVAAGLYDRAIEELCGQIRDLGHPVILRIGYEFNGTTWNGYEPESYKKAFIRIARGIRKSTTDCATCWDAAAAIDYMKNVTDYYPGDQWVDWWGINLFNPDEFGAAVVEKFMQDARAHKKPVLIGESTPKSIGVLRGPASWNAWFSKYFAFIREHPGIKAFCYINWEWSRYPAWSDWGDARLRKTPWLPVTSPLNSHRRFIFTVSQKGKCDWHWVNRPEFKAPKRSKAWRRFSGRTG
jgi:hypothetical protein